MDCFQTNCQSQKQGKTENERRIFMKAEGTEPIVIELERSSDNMVFMADEYVKVDGAPFLSLKDFKKYTSKTDYDWRHTTHHHYIIYCSACKNGTREDDLDIRYEKKQDPGITILGAYKCPCCGTEHQVKRVYHHKREERFSFDGPAETGLYYSNATIDGKTIKRLKTEAVYHEVKECTKIIRWPRNDGKISLSVCYIRWIPTWFNKKYRLVEKPVNYRIVINPETGQSYHFQGFENGKPSRFSEQKAKIRTVTFWDTEYMYNMSVRQAIEKILKQPVSSDSLSNSHLFLRYYLPEMDESQLSILSRMLKSNNGEYVKKRIKEIKRFTSEYSFDSLPRYMQAKSIKRRIAKKSVLYIAYHILHRYGFRDVNIMNGIIDYFDKNKEWLIKLFYNTDTVPEFTKYLIKTRGEKRTKQMLFDMLKDKKDNGRWFADAALGYHTLSNEYNMEIPPLRGNIRELHDKLSLMVLETKHKNHIINYTEEEKALQGNYKGYIFSLAKDTHELLFTGEEMRICVGSYGERARCKMCTIITMKHGDRFAACIELQKNGSHGFKMVQLKAKFNGVVQEMAPIVQWAEKNNILVSDCMDYKRAIQVESSESSPDIFPDVLWNRDNEIILPEQDDDLAVAFDAVFFPAM